jgi:hypothetical protein
MLYAFDLIEHDGQDLRNLPFPDRKAALARLPCGADIHILFNEHVAGDGPTVFEHACRLDDEGIVSKRIDGTYRSGPCPVWIKVRNPASIAVQREVEQVTAHAPRRLPVDSVGLCRISGNRRRASQIPYGVRNKDTPVPKISTVTCPASTGGAFVLLLAGDP